MAEDKILTVEYSKGSLENAKEIVGYLRNRFTEKEVATFYQTFAHFEKLISVFPTLYPKSQKKKIRRAVLSPVLSVYYSIGKAKISIVAILDNRWDEVRKIK